jgi:Spy/CpxP family protein refolding chaperone
MKEVKKIFAVLVIIMFSSYNTSVFAQNKDIDDDDDAKMEKIENMKEALKLSDEQIEKIKIIREQRNIEKKEIKRQLREVNKAEKKEIEALLTEDQKTILKEKREDRKKQRDEEEMVRRREEIRLQNSDYKPTQKESPKETTKKKK